MGLFSRKTNVNERLEAELENTRWDLAAIKQQSSGESPAPAGWDALFDIMSGTASASGVSVTEKTALSVSAVYACVRVIAGAIASLPIPIYQRTGDQSTRSTDHPLNSILRVQPSPLTTAVVHWETVVTQILLQGNSYSLIERPTPKSAAVESIRLLQSSEVEVFKEKGLLKYNIFIDGKWITKEQADILHIPGLGWNGTQGLSTIKHVAQNSVGTALAADEYSASFFANDSTPPGYIRYPDGKKVTKEQADEIRNYWNAKHQGRGNHHKLAVLQDGAEFKEITVSAEDAQLIQTRQFQITDIARIFGVPPHMIGETTGSTSWGTGIEQQSIGFVVYTLQPHLARIEQEINRKLIRSNEFYAKFNVAGLLRGDISARNKAYQIALGGNQQPGYMTVNEVRTLENLQKVKNGDELYQPLTGDPGETGETNVL